MLSRATRYLLAAVQAIVGWEWLVSGLNKVFSGTFPQGLAGTLNQGIQDNPNAWYVSFLHTVVQPNSIFFGYAIEWTELIIGVIFLSGALVLLGRPRVRGEEQHSLAVGFCTAAAIAGLVGAFLCVNFHFFMGGAVVPGINPADPFDEGIDLDALLPPISLLIMMANIVLITELRQNKLFSRMAASMKASFRRFIGIEESRPVEKLEASK